MVESVALRVAHCMSVRAFLETSTLAQTSQYLGVVSSWEEANLAVIAHDMVPLEKGNTAAWSENATDIAEG